MPPGKVKPATSDVIRARLRRAREKRTDLSGYYGDRKADLTPKQRSDMHQRVRDRGRRNKGDER